MVDRTFWDTRVDEFELRERIRTGMWLVGNTKNEKWCAVAADKVAGRTKDGCPSMIIVLL
jgi:hypothetical protein